VSPLVTETEREMWASCRDGLCPGYEQTPVQGIESHVAFTYGELGGGGASTPQEQMIAQLPEREAIHYRWIDMADEPCPYCGRARIIDPNPRIEYETKTGMDPLLLLKRERGLDQEKSDRESALELQRQQLAEARRANDLAEREIAAREREFAAAAKRERAKAPAV
jgi:hypothetical protein